MTRGDEVLRKYERVAEDLDSFGAREVAQAVRETVTRLLGDWTSWWNESLTIAEAARWGGYSESQLRRLKNEGTLPVAPDGGIRRRDVPVQPGHRLPLDLEPAPSGAPDLIANVLQHRDARRAS